HPRFELPQRLSLVRAARRIVARAARLGLGYTVGFPPGHTGACARSGHPIGARHFCSACAGGLAGSHSAAMYRLPDMPSAAPEHNHTIGGTITAGGMRSLRSKPDSSVTIGVSAGP